MVPEEGEIECVVKQLRNNHSGWPSRMRAEHVKQWLTAARKAEKDEDMAGGEEAATETAVGSPETTAAEERAENWTRVVNLV